MGFIDNMKFIFSEPTVIPEEKYSRFKEWYSSEAGIKALNEANSIVDLTDYTYHYLKSSMVKEELVSSWDLYKVAFVLSDSVMRSNQSYAGKECLINSNINPFIAYFQRLSRNISNESLCYEMLLILFGAVDPFDPNAWIYDKKRKGYSKTEYLERANENNIDIYNFLKTDNSGQEDVRYIACQIIWLIGGSAFLRSIDKR